MTVKELIEKYGEPEKFVDSDGIVNYLVNKEMGLDDAVKVVAHIRKESKELFSLCYAYDDGKTITYSTKKKNVIVVWKTKWESV